MRFQLRTLCIVIAGIAVLLGISKAIGILGLSLMLCFCGFIFPAFVANAWLRIGLALGLSGLGIGMLKGAILLFPDSPLAYGPWQTMTSSLPFVASVVVGAVVVSNMIRFTY